MFDFILLHNFLKLAFCLFIYRQHVYTESDEDKGMGEIIIAKHRNGPTGVAKVTFIDEYARFENYEFSEEDALT